MPQDLEITLQNVEEKFGQWMGQIRWINMGGGHLITNENYDKEYLVNLLRQFKIKYPHLHVILEPGSAFTWQTGFLLVTVLDVVENDHVQTAVIDASFACHMPDCLEMPYQPIVRNAVTETKDTIAYRIGGCSCLSGDFVGDYHFKLPIQVGDKIVLEDMVHYTMVKTNMFNGVQHPAIAILKANDTIEVLKTFDYYDYKNRLG
jgi:carboxynorspermidine decarboxylase